MLVLVVETLTEEDRDSIKMVAIQQFGHNLQRNHKRIRYSFGEKVRLLTLRRHGTRIAELSGTKPVYLDCCIDSCHAYTGKYADETEFSQCGNPRYDSKGRTRQTFQYIPITGRCPAFFNNPELMEILLYRHKHAHSENAMDEYFDSDNYKELCDQKIVIDSEDLGDRFFSGEYDTATSNSQRRRSDLQISKHQKLLMLADHDADLELAASRTGKAA
ncbi:hypothetical protein FRC12_017116 [Ceratobasidium sp. 428]|nr:hypothetical protein FRC12_017116 [Ceratobasidium sp. 428]